MAERWRWSKSCYKHVQVTVSYIGQVGLPFGCYELDIHGAGSMSTRFCTPESAKLKAETSKHVLWCVLLLVRLLYVLKQHCITHIVVKILKPTQQPQTQSHPKLPAITWLFTILLVTFQTQIQSPGQQPSPSLYIHLTKHISESMAALGGSSQNL